MSETQGNVVQIKRGNTPPSGVLQPYELGYCTSDRTLYIGEGDGSTTKLATGSESLIPTTTLLKNKKSKIENQTLQIYCYNLKPNTTYTIHLYTLQKNRGNSSRYWRHPANTSAGRKQGEYSGYANFVEEAGHIGVEIPSIPDWMPRDGVLQTEWQFTTGVGEYIKIYELKLNEWLLDLLKPTSDGSWTMIGVSSKNNRKTGRLFQFRIAEKGGAVGATNNTLCLSGVAREQSPEEGYQMLIKYFSIK